MVPPLAFDLTLLFGGAMLLLGVVILAVSARYVWRASAVYRASDRDALDTIAPGALCRISGTTTLTGDSIPAPFSGVDCVALRYHVEERRPSYLFAIPWDVTVHEGRTAVPFDVETGAGPVSVVEPARTVTLTRSVVETSTSDDDVPDRVRGFERDHADVPGWTIWRDPPAVLAPLWRLLGYGTRRYTEQRAAVGDEVTVVGRVTEDGSGVDPLVVSDLSPARTLVRMARTSVGGLLVGLGALALGVFLLVV